MTGDPSTDLGVPSLTDDLASPEQLAELRGGELVWQMLLHQASAELGSLAGYPHSRPARTALDIAAEHIRSAETLLQSLHDVLYPKQSDHGRGMSARHLQQRVEREQQVMSRRADMARTASLEQLDLIADLDAAAAAEAEAEQQRIFDEAPSIFGDTARGFFTRIEIADSRRETYGHGCPRRSHAWRQQGGAGLGISRSDRSAVCRPTALTADLRCDHDRMDCSCVAYRVYRAACLHCAWEGEVHDGENDAVEDAHDHAWTGWRELPIAGKRPEADTSKKQTHAMQRWIDSVEDVYPEGWLEAGGPIRTVRAHYGTRHVPNATGLGGYDLCGHIEPEPAR